MLNIVVSDSTSDFAALKEGWEDLYRNSPLATPFQTWAWLYSWWQSYKEGYELRLITLRSEEELLVGIIPLMLERRGRFRRLLFVGTGLTDYLDALVREGWEDEVSEAGVWALRQMNSWQMADLQQLRPEAAAWRIFKRWNGPRTRVWQDVCPIIDLEPWDELVASLSKNHRSTVRRALRRAEADGIYPKIADQADAEQAARRLVALHREGWQGRDITPEHRTHRFESCVVAAAYRMTASGLGGISEFWSDEQVIVSHFWILGQDSLGTLILGASEEAFQRYQWSSLYIWDAANIALSRNCSHLDLLRGGEPYKLRWNSRRVSNYRMVLGWNRAVAVWTFYAGYLTLRSRAKRYAHSEEAPLWIKNAEKRFRALRDRVDRYVKSGCILH